MSGFDKPVTRSRRRLSNDEDRPAAEAYRHSTEEKQKAGPSHVNVIRSGVCKRLTFCSSDEEEQAKGSNSPPCHRVRELSILDNSLGTEPMCIPVQPSIEEKSHNDSWSALFGLENVSQYVPKEKLNESNTFNPFTPEGQKLAKKRSLSGGLDLLPFKKVKESNITRFNFEFIDLGLIGSGAFGSVTKCKNKLDGCIYAVKKSLRPVAGWAERAALTEIYANAALAQHPNVVRYYSSWAEDDHILIQSEYCDGGSLEEQIQTNPLPEHELLVLLEHVSLGLKYIHSMNLAHMDLKPGNILKSCVYPNGSADEEHNNYIYKISDLGHVTLIASSFVEEGDGRYVALEVIRGDFTELSKSDIYSFGITLFEAAGGGPLPKNGHLWHQYRNGNLPYLESLSKEFNDFIKTMVDPDPDLRPSAATILTSPILVHQKIKKTNKRLCKELADSKRQIALLEKKVRELTEALQKTSTLSSSN